MGNCQAIDAAALVIQHPDGRIERLYWPVMASEVMKNNPGHYVSLIIPLPSPTFEEDKGDPKAVRFTRVKLLRPSETLALGHAYRLITSQEVIKVLRSKKYAKMKKQQQQPEKVEESESEVGVSAPRDTSCQTGGGGGAGSSDPQKTNQVSVTEKLRLLVPLLSPQLFQDMSASFQCFNSLYCITLWSIATFSF
ncbi:hypothetical protein EUGRSUZ_B03364 [Eucalyptus grandis]|uniref:Uncharacterized protein n=2 Tax=Eucalyptus grandis TaxID=71139 RepID=A0ACC3LWV5_EUCGR|nr:hypothetical protein EUGRSUZ_B03364 [Eucalyptus grandis]